MKTPARLLAAVAFFRLSCLVPGLIDDDEAWWAASAHAMNSPWEFYRRAVDPKPPGVVWVYWLCDRITASGIADPRVARAFYVLCCFGGAWVLAVMSRHDMKQRPRVTPLSRPFSRPLSQAEDEKGWLAAAFFLLASAAPSIKLFSFTAEGLLAVISTGIFALAFLSESLLSAIFCGVLLGIALLVKQTAIFFALPLLLTRQPWKRLGVIAVATTLVLIPCLLALDPREFLYWNWSYPFHRLGSVRRDLFDTGLEFASNGILFAVVTAPLLWATGRWIARTRRASLRDYRLLWFLSSLAAVALGRGLFLHYFLLCVPPLCLIAAEEFQRFEIPVTRGLAWLAIPYFVECMILMVPSSGIFWGLDMPYFQAISRTIRLSLRTGERVLIWGGSPVPLVGDGHSYVTRFVLPRFAEPPYSTPETTEIFHRELKGDPPAAVIDLHERGDNRFSHSIESDPTLEKMLRVNYRLYLMPTLPWARFYFRQPPLPTARLVEVPEPRRSRLAQTVFPPERKPWLAFLRILNQTPLGQSFSMIGMIRALDLKLRARSSLELLALQSMDSKVRKEARGLLQRIAVEPWGPPLQKEVEPFLSTSSPPFPWRSFLWWPEVAVVQLQPRALPLKTP